VIGTLFVVGRNTGVTGGFTGRNAETRCHVHCATVRSYMLHVIISIIAIIVLLFIGFYFGWNAAKKEFQNQGREW